MSYFNHVLCPEHKLGLTQAGMTTLELLGIPYPNHDPFNEFSVRYVRGDLSMRGDGYPEFTWEWVGLDYDQTYKLLEYFITLNTASKRVYVRTRTNRVGTGSRFQDYLATMASPILTGADGDPALQGIMAFSPIKVNFTGAVEV